MNSYNLSYPITTDWNKLIWMIEKGDIINYQGKEYKVLQILKSSTYKIEPRIILELIS